MIDSVDFLLDFIDDLPIGIARTDTTGILPNYYNNFFLNMFGWEFEDIQTIDEWFQKAYPDDVYRADVLKRWGEMIEDTEAKKKSHSDAGEFKVTCKDGSVKWCQVRYYHKAHFLYGILVDISEQKEAEIKLQNLSLMDSLTNIYNRRYFNTEYYDRWNLSQRTQTPISIIMCDVDDFKAVNDTYGHLVGDQVLITIAQAMSDMVKRSSDFVARYGGEEFVIVSYDCDKASALNLCEMIKNKMENTVWGINDQCDNYCSLSYGVNTIIASTDSTPEDFINNADKALYEAKNSGKNRIVVYEN